MKLNTILAPALLAGALGLCIPGQVLAAGAEPTTGTKSPSVANQLKLTPPVLGKVDLNKGELLVTVQTILMRWEASGGAAARFRISESSSFSGVPWQTVNLSINNGTTGSYTFANSIEGLKTIYVQLQNDGGDSNILSRNVEYRKPIEQVKLSSVQINNGASHTQELLVKITHSVTGKPTHYRACESCTAAGLGSMGWQSYQANPVFTLSPADGKKVVHFQVKGESIPSAFGGSPTPNESVIESANINFYMGERCFGALGMECALAYCAGQVCNINAGSWEHDECCWAEKIKGTGKSCISFVPNQPAEVCATSWSKAWNRLTFNMSWNRVVDTNIRDTDGKVDFSSYCALKGSRLHKDDAKYCCSGRAVQPSTPDTNLDARVCT